MTRFEVPEPSEAAVNAVLNGGYLTPSRMMLCAAYAVDVPAIVRAEVERALREVGRWATLSLQAEERHKQEANAYLASRFGPPNLTTGTTSVAGTPDTLPRFPEAAPEPKMGETLHTCTMGPDCPNHQTYITPSAPAEPCPSGDCGFCEPPCAPPSAAPAKTVDTRCRVSGNLGRCVLDVDHPGIHQFYTVQPLAAARPEAEPVSEALRDMVGRSLRPCTACGCERCSNERAFVRELAKLSSLASLGRYPNEALVRAAAKVSE